MSKTRAFTLAAVVVLVGAHVLLLVVGYASSSASLWGDIIGAVFAPLLASVAAWSAARDSVAFGRRVWRLVTLSLLLAVIGGVLYTYSYDYAQKPPGFWPSDIFVFFWAVPAMMTLFLSSRDPTNGFRWLRICDFVQVSTLVLSMELSQLYVPSRWQASSDVMASRALEAGIFFFGLLALSFLARGVFTTSRLARRLFLRLAVFFFAFSITTNVTLYGWAANNYKQGTWPDLLWTITYCLLAALAATWRDPSRGATKTLPPRSRRTELLAQFLPLLIPAIVFPLALGIAQEQFLWSVILVTASFVAASGRLFVVQNQMLVSWRELEKSLALLRGITEGATDAIFVKDLEGRYLMMNSAGARLLGRSVEEVIGRTDAELFVPEVGRDIMDRDRRVIESGYAQTYEEVGTAAGVTRSYSAIKGPFHDPNGQLIGLLGICRDITDRKRAEEEIRQSQKKLRMHLDHTPLAVIEWDLDFRVADWNPAAERMFGYSRAEALGQHAHFIVPQEYRERVDRVWQNLLAPKNGVPVPAGPRFGRNDNVTKDGRMISCEWYNTPLVDDSGHVLGVASLVHDVTERVTLEDRLRQSQKMEAIGRLAGGVAHDFNNLLTVIIGYAQFLADDAPAGSAQADSIAQIQAAADRAAGITRQLLAFSRKQVLSPRIINLNDIVLNLDSLLRRLIGEDIEVIAMPANDLGSVRADPGQIEQVLMNLALNARDAMPQGGTLTLETANVELDQAYASEHQPISPGHYVMLAVSDNGQGMIPEVRARVFEPFFTTKEVGKGTGLGLSTVYGIIKQSGGYIWVDSEPGRGTSFKIYFPRVDLPAQTLGPERHTSGVQRGTETILLVEDDPQLRQLSSSVLAHCGYKVLVAGGPEEGLAVAQAPPRDIRLLITDVIMPTMNGRQLADKVLQICPKMRVLYISGYTNNAIAHYGVLNEGLWFLPKPFTLSALIAKVREVLDAPTGGM